MCQRPWVSSSLVRVRELGWVVLKVFNQKTSVIPCCWMLKDGDGVGVRACSVMESSPGWLGVQRSREKNELLGDLQEVERSRMEIVLH